MFVFNFGLNNLNNGRLSGIKAMPAKDLSSDADSGFASDRRVYENILSTNLATPGPHQISQKKWIGGSRDASDVSYQRRVAAAGASMNPSGGSFSFTSKTEKNTVIDALNRCRNQGKCAPPKVRASKHYTNLLTPIWKPPSLVRTQFHAVMTKETPMTKKKINTVNGFS